MPLDIQHKRKDQSDSLLGEEKLFCAACDHWITTSDWKMSIKDAHEHTVFNPAGHLFHIGCFREAPGCIPLGQPSANFSWFKGYKWQITVCGGCSKHLGWLFTGLGPVPAFHGLILNRIRSRIIL